MNVNLVSLHFGNVTNASYQTLRVLLTVKINKMVMFFMEFGEYSENWWMAKENRC